MADVDPDATAMAISLAMVSDSSGKTPAAGDTVTITFEPPSTVHLVALDWANYATLAYAGTYSFSGTNLTLKFTTSGFTRGATIAFDATKPTLTLPFQVFSTDKGTSTWTRDIPYVAQNVQDLFVALSGESPTMSLTDRTSRVFAYAQRYVTAHADVQTQALRQGALAPHAAVGYPWFLDPFVTSVTLNEDGTELVFVYGDGSQGSVIVCERIPLGPGVLTDSPLAADPRTTIAITPVNGNDDPKSHTALFIAPFDGVKYYGFYPAGNNGPGGSNGTQYGFGPSDNLGGMQTVLEGAGFSANSVHTIKNSDVTVEAVAKAFTSGPAPGFIYFSTHGSKTGMIATGQFLGLGHDGIAAALNKVYAQLRTDGYGDLLDYGVDPGDKTPITLGQICVTPAIGGRPTGGSACYVGLTSAFFDWLRLKRGVDFSSSLVMMAACRTDETSVLRSAFLSRAYFSYNVSVQGTFAGAVFQNFVRSLVRHTHTAEEAYYNVLRVVNARQIIYPEDSVFKGISAIDDTGKYSIQEAFQGYFAETGTMLNYQDTGWLDTKDANPGSIWLLLYAGRGGGNAQQGSNNFSTCWKGPWGMGSTGTLGTWCYQSAPGYAPHPPEVAYANFLLTGSDQGNGLPVVGKTVARWTLNDSK